MYRACRSSERLLVSHSVYSRVNADPLVGFRRSQDNVRSDIR